MNTLTELPDHLPVPEDDGGCHHLQGARLPAVCLPSTQGRQIDLSSLQQPVVLYCYPMTGHPDVPLPNGWDQIPGARGCTPQSCSFRDHHRELQALGTNVFGISTQHTDDQREAAERLHLPFELLSDQKLTFANNLRLPTFRVGQLQLLKRVTLIAIGGRIEKVFYPVFPPDRNADDVVAWLKKNRR